MRGGATEVNVTQKWATSKERLRTAELDNSNTDTRQAVNTGTMIRFVCSA
jgi:hypothetical protein